MDLFIECSLFPCIKGNYFKGKDLKALMKVERVQQEVKDCIPPCSSPRRGKTHWGEKGKVMADVMRR